MKDSSAEQLEGIDADTDSAEQPVKLLLIAYVQLLRCAARHFLENFLCCENDRDADADSAERPVKCLLVDNVQLLRSWWASFLRKLPLFCE